MRKHLSHPDQLDLEFPVEVALPRHTGLRKVLQRILLRGDLRGTTEESQQQAADLLCEMDYLSDEEIQARVQDLRIHVSDAILARHAKIDFWRTRGS